MGLAEPRLEALKEAGLELTGDPANAGPMCGLSLHHHLVTEAGARAERAIAASAAAQPLVSRDHRESDARE